MNHFMQELTKRVGELETESRPEEPANVGKGVWRPIYVFLGGWPRNKDKREIERQALDWILTIPEAERGAYTKPNAPGCHESIEKVHVDPSAIKHIGFSA